MRVLTYASVVVIPVVAWVALLLGDRGGWWGLLTWVVPVAIYGVMPLVELGLPGSRQNVGAEEEGLRREDWRFDAVVWSMVPLQIGLVGLLVWQAQYLSAVSLVGAVVTVGTCCGAVGLNVGHELGHRRNKLEQLLARLLFGTSLYVHFFVEHNRGHHARVATDEDPASAKRGEVLFPFVVRSVGGGVQSAWGLERVRLSKKGRSVWSVQNEVLLGWVVQLVLLGVAFLVSPVGALAWMGAAVFGVYLLETINYVEHYGLRREKLVDGRWERVSPAHSWTSDRPVSRALLFDLTRHADHHAHPNRPYQLLRHMSEAPELPTGYAGMLLLAQVPPLFLYVMERQLVAVGRLSGDGSSAAV